jgi:hypothetical protein
MGSGADVHPTGKMRHNLPVVVGYSFPGKSTRISTNAKPPPVPIVTFNDLLPFWLSQFCQGFCCGLAGNISVAQCLNQRLNGARIAQLAQRSVRDKKTAGARRTMLSAIRWGAICRSSVMICSGLNLFFGMTKLLSERSALDSLGPKKPGQVNFWRF